MMAIWITLDDRGYRLAEYAVEPDNAIAGPFASAERAHLKMDYYAQDGTRSARVLVWLMAIVLSAGFVAFGWVLRGAM